MAAGAPLSTAQLPSVPLDAEQRGDWCSQAPVCSVGLVGRACCHPEIFLQVAAELREPASPNVCSKADPACGQVRPSHWSMASGSSWSFASLSQH